MLRLFVLFITFPPKKSVRADKWPGALFVYYILFFSRVGRECAGGECICRAIGKQLSEPETQAFYRLPGMPLSRDLLFFLSNAIDFIRYGGI